MSQMLAGCCIYTRGFYVPFQKGCFLFSLLRLKYFHFSLRSFEFWYSGRAFKPYRSFFMPKFGWGKGGWLR
ncbi:hypothetical protein X792_07180 [Dehalococcoides mccartyi CG1]|nr:hypothetical protein X792_07180 [Dehalococcoides mccartyi CG1]